MTLTIETQKDIQYYSISRLDAFNKCGQYYKLKYIDRVPSDSLSKSTLLGSLLHKALEALYTNDWGSRTLLDYFPEAVTETLIKAKIVGEFELDLIQTLKEYSKLTELLYLKANPNYEGPDAIRTKDGKVPANPQMTSQWKKLEGQLGISIRKEAIDKLFQERPPHINFSICDVLSEGRNLCSQYLHHQDITEVHGIEVPLSEVRNEEIINAVPLDEFGIKGYFLHGYIDFLGVYKGEPIVIDHKSSLKAPTEEDISHHIQLLSYSWAMDRLNPSMPIKYIGIDHIRSGRVIVTEVPQYRDQLLKEYFEVHQDIDNGLFRKRHNMCSDWYGGKCPYYYHCHTPT